MQDLKKFFVLAISGLLIISLTLIGLQLRPAYKATPCTSRNISQDFSPNKSWKAVEYTKDCFIGDSDDTHLTYVKLVSVANPKNSADVFGIDSAGYPNYNPTMSWVGSNKLRINTIQFPLLDLPKEVITGLSKDNVIKIQHTSPITIQKSSFSGISITYAYHKE